MSKKQVTATVVYSVRVTVDRQADDEATKEALVAKADEYAETNISLMEGIIHECDDESLID